MVYIAGMATTHQQEVSMFRTRTGQTGTDAYINEAAQIVNAQRELDERAARLAEIMASEIPATVSVQFDMSSERYPDATYNADHDSLQRILRLNGLARDALYLRRIAQGMADPSYVVRHLHS